MRRQQSLHLQSSLPEDVAIKIVSCLEVSDVCSLGSCARFWREICGSDFVWKSICEERWPQLALDKEPSTPRRESPDPNQEKDSNFKGWKEYYIKKHNEMAVKVAYIGECFSCEPISVDIYHKAIEEMMYMKFGFKDIQIHFLKPKITVLLNLVGLHYCIRHLRVQVDALKEVICNCKIQERQVSVQWCRRGWWMHRFPLPHELHFHSISLEDLTTDEGEEVLEVLDYGITYQVSRIQISTAKRPNEQHCRLTFSRNWS